MANGYKPERAEIMAAEGHYDFITIDLGVDRTVPEYYDIYCDKVTVKSITGTAYIRFGQSPRAPRVNLSVGDRFRFDRHIDGFQIENSPSPGDTLVLGIGFAASFEFIGARRPMGITDPTGAEIYPKEQPGTEENSVTGTTTDSFTDALDWDTRYEDKKSIIIANTDSANDLDYRVLVRAYYAGIDHTEHSGTIAAGGTERVALNDVLARVIVQVKANVAGNQASYQIDYIT